MSNEPSPFKKLFPSVNIKNREELQRTLFLLETVKSSAKRKLEEAEQPQPKKKVKTDFINYQPNIALYDRKRYEKEATDWPIGTEEFKAMSKASQDTILMTLISEIKEASNKRGFITMWHKSKSDVQKYYKVGNDRMDRIAKNVWKSVSKTESGQKQSFVTNLAPHGNTGSTPKHALSDNICNQIKDFIHSLDTEPMPFNYIAGKKDATVLPPSTDRNALYGEFIDFLHEREVTETCGYSTFYKKEIGRAHV